MRTIRPLARLPHGPVNRAAPCFPLSAGGAAAAACASSLTHKTSKRYTQLDAARYGLSLAIPVREAIAHGARG